MPTCSDTVVPPQPRAFVRRSPCRISAAVASATVNYHHLLTLCLRPPPHRPVSLVGTAAIVCAPARDPSQLRACFAAAATRKDYCAHPPHRLSSAPAPPPPLPAVPAAAPCGPGHPRPRSPSSPSQAHRAAPCARALAARVRRAAHPALHLGHRDGVHGGGWVADVGAGPEGREEGALEGGGGKKTAQ